MASTNANNFKIIIPSTNVSKNAKAKDISEDLEVDLGEKHRYYFIEEIWLTKLNHAGIFNCHHFLFALLFALLSSKFLSKTMGFIQTMCSIVLEK